MSTAMSAVVIVTDRYLVKGLTCRRCIDAVVDAVVDAEVSLPSVASVTVDLARSTWSVHRHQRQGQ